MVPTLKTGNARMCLLLADGRMGTLRTEDAERLQVYIQLFLLFLLQIA